jgi:HEAT repeat protein
VAVQALDGVKDPRAIKPLIAALKDSDRLVQEMAGPALGRFGAAAVDPLIGALKNSNDGVREWAAYALGRIKDPRAVEPLIAALKDPGSDVRMQAAYALSCIKDPRRVGPLMAVWKEHDTAAIAGAYLFFLERGVPGVEDVLIEALNQYNYPAMANNFLHCNNTKLAQAAFAWARKNGYRIETTSPGAPGWVGPR